jgi:hypothetical protein
MAAAALRFYMSTLLAAMLHNNSAHAEHATESGKSCKFRGIANFAVFALLRQRTYAELTVRKRSKAAPHSTHTRKQPNT